MTRISETYLPIRESLGYKNLKNALINIFNINLDKEQIFDGDFENFKYELYYKGVKIKLFITSTQKNIQFQYGEGGELDISLPNPRYPKDSFLSETSLRYFLDNEQDALFVRFISGASSLDVEKALQILKKYLDNLNK